VSGPAPGSGADRFDLDRFVQAQAAGASYQTALAELRRGLKASHWMWYIFPQVAGLGRSQMSQRYAISSLEEAQAYLAHPVLGPRLSECAAVVAATEAKTAQGIFGPVDAQKLQSCMTLFMRAVPGPGNVFGQVIDRYFDGHPDPKTEALI
jgi:uncharacterized protein (DUF1810 family)